MLAALLVMAVQVEAGRPPPAEISSTLLDEQTIEHHGRTLHLRLALVERQVPVLEEPSGRPTGRTRLRPFFQILTGRQGGEVLADIPIGPVHRSTDDRVAQFGSLAWDEQDRQLLVALGRSFNNGARVALYKAPLETVDGGLRWTKPRVPLTAFRLSDVELSGIHPVSRARLEIVAGTLTVALVREGLEHSSIEARLAFEDRFWSCIGPGCVETTYSGLTAKQELARSRSR